MGIHQMHKHTLASVIGGDSSYLAEKVRRWARMIMAACRRTSSLSFSKRCSRDSFMKTCMSRGQEFRRSTFKDVKGRAKDNFQDLTLVLPSCHSFFVLSYLNRRSVLLFLSSPTAGVFSFIMILYLR